MEPVVKVIFLPLETSLGSGFPLEEIPTGSCGLLLLICIKTRQRMRVLVMATTNTTIILDLDRTTFGGAGKGFARL